MNLFDLKVIPNPYVPDDVIVVSLKTFEDLKANKQIILTKPLDKVN